MPKLNPFPLSIEFFPPKNYDGSVKLAAVRKKLYEINPAFCSVTFGAGGSTQEGTFNTVRNILEEGVSAASHLSCIGATRSKVREQISALRKMGVNRLVALRGDMPSGYGAGGEFQYASDLVHFIRSETSDTFHIEVAAYPETHPQAPSPLLDIQALLKKKEAGANSAITQYFFNADSYFRFIEEATSLGVSIPIVPGIMPINSASKLIRFSDACGAEIPRWIRLRLQSFGDDVGSIKSFGLEVVTALCEKLLAGGAPGLHFYSMNQSEPIIAICKNLNLPKNKS